MSINNIVAPISMTFYIIFMIQKELTSVAYQRNQYSLFRDYF